MISYLVSGLIIILAITLIAFIPNKVVNVDGNLRLVSALGTGKKIPMSAITIIPSPINKDTKFTRICGVKVGSRMSGLFRDKEKHYYNFYVTGQKPTVFFEYGGKTYMVDSWDSLPK